MVLDMRHAPFFGWIKDLSAPDPTSVFNLFGLLPIPALEHYFLGYTIGAWAIVMGITMWLQMQLNPKQPDPVQQQIFSWMPVMFTFLLASFPAGLVIYWAWSNTLSLAQQYYIMKRQGAEIHLMGNISDTFKPVQACSRMNWTARAICRSSTASTSVDCHAATPSGAIRWAVAGRRPATGRGSLSGKRPERHEPPHLPAGFLSTILTSRVPSRIISAV